MHKRTLNKLLLNVSSVSLNETEFSQVEPPLVASFVIATIIIADSGQTTYVRTLYGRLQVCMLDKLRPTAVRD